MCRRCWRHAPEGRAAFVASAHGFNLTQPGSDLAGVRLHGGDLATQRLQVLDDGAGRLVAHGVEPATFGVHRDGSRRAKRQARARCWKRPPHWASREPGHAPAHTEAVRGHPRRGRLHRQGDATPHAGARPEATPIEPAAPRPLWLLGNECAIWVRRGKRQDLTPVPCDPGSVTSSVLFTAQTWPARPAASAPTSARAGPPGVGPGTRGPGRASGRARSSPACPER